jgi:peptidoglycan/xylan/chitin deacetylase (PgdA/CDA1 family)
MGSVVVSIDAELAWGFHDLFPLPERIERRVSNAREAWRRLVEMLDQYAVPATWAVVGHLASPDENVEAEYDELPAGIETLRAHGDGRRESWFGEDLVRDVVTADTAHEIGSHTYTHPEMGTVSAQVFETELRLSRRMSSRFGVTVESFVFPRNVVEHRSLLKQHGFSCYRGPRPGERRRSELRENAAFLFAYLTDTTAPPIVTPTVDEFGLVDVPISMYLGGRKGRPWPYLDWIRGDPVVDMARRGIDSVASRDGVFHVYLHPNDLTCEEDFERLEAILSYVSRKRDQGAIGIETMGEVARTVTNGRPRSRGSPT